MREGCREPLQRSGQSSTSGASRRLSTALMAAMILGGSMLMLMLLLGTPVRRGVGGTELAAPARGGPVVLPTNWGGVHRYSIPGELPTDRGDANRTGVLHIYLKALRWPAGDGTFHLRARGFIAFEWINKPDEWTDELYTFRNVPEVARQLRLFLENVPGGWKREVSIEDAHSRCDRLAKDPRFNFDACLATWKRSPPKYGNLPVIDVDLGAEGEVEWNLRVHNWPRFVSLKAQLQGALQAPPAEPEGPPPRLLLAYPYTHSLGAAWVSNILRLSHGYHGPLGFDGAVMYVLPSDVLDMESHAGIRAHVAAGRVTLVLFDEFSWYEGWRDKDTQIYQSHSVLTFWGQNVRLLVIDPDEFFVPGTGGLTLPAMRAEGGCLAASNDGCKLFERHDIFPNQNPKRLNESSWWMPRAAGPMPLRRYRITHGTLLPKLMVDPNKAFPPNVHFSTTCAGTSEVATNASDAKLQSACTARKACSWVPEECAWIAHVPNMFSTRRQPWNRTEQGAFPRGWLWMFGAAKVRRLRR